MCALGVSIETSPCSDLLQQLRWCEEDLRGSEWEGLPVIASKLRVTANSTPPTETDGMLTPPYRCHAARRCSGGRN